MMYRNSSILCGQLQYLLLCSPSDSFAFCECSRARKQGRSPVLCSKRIPYHNYPFGK